MVYDTGQDHRGIPDRINSCVIAENVELTEIIPTPWWFLIRNETDISQEMIRKCSLNTVFGHYSIKEINTKTEAVVSL